MQSFLLSALAARFKAGGYASFQAVHANPWLVWEPGPWLPSQAGATLLSVPKLDLKAGLGKTSKERLCIALKAVAGKPQLILGRSETSDLEVNDATLSRAHLALSMTGPNSWSVADLGSSNGSWLNGQKLGPTPLTLKEGSQLQAGQVYLTYHEAIGLWPRIASF